ncbi:MAG: Gfo/Idh/MocA family oxidoreductase [Chloroflexota bacterium]|nr:Gfo/Idh/MocA family oxidoreductase [Chloroflexota bacterium]
MTIRVAILGCGKIARLHAQGYKTAADLAQVTVCCDEYSEELAQKMAAEFNAAVTTRWQDVLEGDDVDAVSICMPPHQHAPIALAAAAAGKHVLVEKPMALNLAECKTMVAAAAEAGTVLMVGQNQRWQPEHIKIKELLDRNAIGRIVALRFDCNQFVKHMYPPDSWIFDKAKSGGGMIAQTAVHKIDLMRHFFGEIEEVSAFNGYTGLNLNYQPGGNEDIAALLMNFESGIVGEAFYLFAAHKVPIPTATGELTIFYGEKGIIHNVMGWHIYSTDIPEYSGGVTKLDIHPHPYSDSVNAEVRHFLECIRDQKEPLTSGRDNLGTMAVVDALYQAAATKTVVKVEKTQTAL